MTLERFSGVNAGYVLELYEKYRQDPQSVDAATREVFDSWVPADALSPAAPAPSAAAPASVAPDLHVIVGAANLAESIRRFGHLAAQLDPLGSAQIGDSTLRPEAHGITDGDLRRLPASLVGGPPAEHSANAYEAIEKLRRVYCSTTGFDIAHLFVPAERVWMREAAESGRYLPAMDPIHAEALLDRLTQVEVFERFLQRTFTGKTRFSIEGLDMLLPILDEIMVGAAGTGTRHLMLGMAHRGRAPIFDGAMTLPVLIHGDSAFPGQGIVAETLNLSRLDGYHTDGTIHIIANNQLGFTATPGESYSTSYASGLARGFKIPIIHVNADDPAACLEAATMAWEYRARFHKDFLIDLVGYRRHGHNEGDEPAFTQPVMYKHINAHPTVRELFSESLVKHGTVSQDVADGLVKKHFTVLEQTFAALKPEEDFVAPIPTPAAPGLAAKTQTGVPIELLRDLNESLLSTPDGFHVHKKLERIRDRKRAMLTTTGERTVDWGGAEELAFASILAEGTPIRLTGEDVQRGTFSHRHAVLHDAETGVEHVPLQQLPQARGSFEIHNSPLTEAATIGFEFGYNMQEPQHLVIWEAQYGDFINGAQIILDQFVTSSRSKWGLKPSLVFLLPHGYEGQGPEHSSARPERFLQAAADINLRLVNCTTAAQYFHVLRRQAALLEKDPLPLVILTPKSLLRHPAVASTPIELEHGRFLPVIDDEHARLGDEHIDRVVLCTGKVYVDLMTSERRGQANNIAICRVEQLYPFPKIALNELLARYASVRDVVWLQEEPENMGAWEFMRPHLEELIGDRCPLRYIGRARSSSPSEGSAAWHQVNQKKLVEQAFDMDSHTPEPSMVLSKEV